MDQGIFQHQINLIYITDQKLSVSGDRDSAERKTDVLTVTGAHFKH